MSELALEIEKHRRELITQNHDLRDSLRKLSNEAAGFLAMADRSVHGNTNMAVLKLRIDDARALLESTKP